MFHYFAHTHKKKHHHEKKKQEDKEVEVPPEVLPKSLAPVAEKQSSTQPFEYFCDVCSYTIEVGEYRYDCRVCAKDVFNCCEVCYKESQGKDELKKLHAHTLFRVATLSS
jgi:hypothetical protein